MRISRTSEYFSPLSYAIVSLSIFGAGAANGAASSIAHVPFDFSVGEITFRAGPYLLESSDMPSTFSIRPADDGAPKSLVQAIGIPRQNDGLSRKLLFYCRGDRYFLAQVLVATADEINPLPLLPEGGPPAPDL